MGDGRVHGVAHDERAVHVGQGLDGPPPVTDRVLEQKEDDDERHPDEREE
jgi:hypothetical protein